MEYCCFNGKAFPRFDFTAYFQYGRHALSFVLVQVTVNAPLVRVKLLRAINGNPDSYSYLYSCLCERSLRSQLSYLKYCQNAPKHFILHKNFDTSSHFSPLCPLFIHIPVKPLVYADIVPQLYVYIGYIGLLQLWSLYFVAR